MESLYLQGQKPELNTVFPNKFCINLERRPERLAQVNEEFEKHGINGVMRFAAIDGKALDYKGPLNAGQMGCTLSHLLLLEYARDNDFENILLFEDDLQLAPNFNEVFEKAIAELPDDWCMLYFGGNHFKGTEPHSPHLVKLKGTLTTHAIAIHRRFYDVAIATIGESLDRVIDVYYMILHEQYPCYCIHPKIAFQRPGYSDLENRQVDYTVLK